MGETLSMTELVKLVNQWAKERGLQTANPAKQLLKLMEELGETSQALCKNNPDGIIDGIGDMLVVIIILCAQLRQTPEHCLQVAYNEIKDRNGKIVDGCFIKEGDLKLTNMQEVNNA